MAAFHKPFEFLGQNMRVTASVGLGERSRAWLDDR